MSASHLALAIAVVAALGPRVAAGQTLAGRVVRSNVAVSGAVVVLIDDAGRSVAQAATHEGGRYSVTAPTAGSYRVQVLQIGWRPMMAGPFVLRSGATTSANLDAMSARILLEPVIVTDHSECRVHPDSAAAAFVLWDEARKALLSAAMTRSEPLTMTLTRTIQDLDRSGSRVLSDSTTSQTGSSLRPFVSLAPDSLAKHGYMSADAAGNRNYWGPDAEVLLSESFVSTHCLRLAVPKQQAGDSARVVGVAFSPSGKRGNVVEVEGVVWLDRTNGELLALDYHYLNTSPVVEKANPGGRVEFLRIPGGRWIVHQWSIRVPSTTTHVRRGDAPVVPGQQRMDTQYEELVAIRRTGGQVTEIRRGNDVLWERGRVTLAVRVVDSATSQPVRGVLVQATGSQSATATDADGTVRLDRIAPGPLTLRLESATLEALGRSPILVPVEVTTENDVTTSIAIPSERAVVMGRCGPRTIDWGEGLVRGMIENADSVARRSPLVVTWKSEFARLGGGEPVVSEERREVSPDADGTFEVCGVPRDATFAVYRVRGSTLIAIGRFPEGSLATRVSIKP